jgi:hypothetical protein
MEGTWHHSLIDCNRARCFWALGDEEVVEHMISNQCDDPKVWLFSMMETLDHAKFTEMMVTMWVV